ncbi:MAG: accessory gene regulator B family protein [Lachnospiraceae bacterium]|nr:accessory gene regulator B family protein [Lachnospiraceae bacterium]
MLEQITHKIVNHQIEKGILQESDRNIYQYGYQMLMEFGINILTSIVIAILFQAFEIVIVFTIAYLMMRGYAGGYHAKTSVGCFGMSAGILILSILAVQKLTELAMAWWILLVIEVVMMPVIFIGTPIPVKNKPITNNEYLHFKKKVKQIYCIELVIIMILFWCDKPVYAFSIMATQAVIFVMTGIDIFSRVIQKRLKKSN